MLKNNKGFTIMELVVVMFAMSIVTAAVAPFIRVNVDSYVDVRKSKYSIQTARIAFNKMLSELRFYANTSSIVRARSTRIGFTTPNGDYIEYVYSSDEKGIGIADSWVSLFMTPTCDPFIGGVENFSISYFDQNGNTTSSIASIHRIRVIMVLQDLDDSSKQMSFVGQVCLNRF